MISKMKNLLHPYIIINGNASSHSYPRTGIKKANLYLWLPFGITLKFITDGKLDLSIVKSSSVWFKFCNCLFPEIWRITLYLDFGKTYCWIGKGTNHRMGRFAGWETWKLPDIGFRKSAK